MPIQIDWSRAALCMQEGECVGAYKLISVAHTVQQADGSALPGTALDLQVATDANGNAMEYVDSSRGISRVFVRLGNEKTQYRIKVTATFTDCGLTWTSVKCVSVFVTEA